MEYRVYDPETNMYYNDINIDGEHIKPGKGIWVLRDGDPDNGKKSTNGTWLFVDELFPISDELVFKAGHTLFQSSLFQPNSSPQQKN